MTSKEFARLLGVSQATISRAMNNSPLVTDETKALVMAKAAEVGFELNSQAQSLKTRKTGNVGLLFPSHFRSMTDNLMLAHFYDRIQRELIRNDYDVMTIFDDDAGSGVSPLERIIKRRKVDGVINLRSSLTNDEVDLIGKNHFPCVSMFAVPRKAPELHYCALDSKMAGVLAGDFFGAHPKYRPVFVGIDEEPEESALRLEGFRKGLNRHDRELREADVLSCPVSYAGSYAFAQKLLSRFKRERTAVFAYNDVVGMGISAAVWEAQLQVPEQVQVLGVDDLPLSTWRRPYLSTLGYMTDDIVSSACAMLRELMEKQAISGQNGRTYGRKFKPRLILRDTTIESI